MEKVFEFLFRLNGSAQKGFQSVIINLLLAHVYHFVLKKEATETAPSRNNSRRTRIIIFKFVTLNDTNWQQGGLGTCPSRSHLSYLSLPPRIRPLFTEHSSTQLPPSSHHPLRVTYSV